MSGGSYEYMSNEMQSGEVERFSRYADTLVKDLHDLAAKLSAGEIQSIEDYVGKSGMKCGRYVPYAEPHLAAFAVPGALRHAERARDLLHELQRLLRELAPIAHAIEWWRSNDTHSGDAADACVAWMRKKLELDR